MGNLAAVIASNDLEAMFSPFGTVRTASVNCDRTTGRSQGFGFVEMGNSQEAEAARQALGGRAIHGQNITVRFAPSATRVRRPGLGRRFL